MYSFHMDEDHVVIAKLRQDQRLEKMADGAEGVPISLQYKGSVPSLPRPERKQWLLERFNHLEDKLSHLGIEFDSQTLSLSGQTVEARCNANCFEQVRKALPSDEYAITVVRKLQVTS